MVVLCLHMHVHRCAYAQTQAYTHVHTHTPVITTANISPLLSGVSSILNTYGGNQGPEKQDKQLKAQGWQEVGLGWGMWRERYEVTVGGTVKSAT